MPSKKEKGYFQKNESVTALVSFLDVFWGGYVRQNTLFLFTQKWYIYNVLQFSIFYIYIYINIHTAYLKPENMSGLVVQPGFTSITYQN